MWDRDSHSGLSHISLSHCEAENAGLACDLAVVGSGKKGDFLVFEQLDTRLSSHRWSQRDCWESR